MIDALLLQDCIRCSAETPAGALDLLLPYLGGKKYKAMFGWAGTNW